MNKATATFLGIILVLAIAGGSFYGGMLFGKSQATTQSAQAITFQADGDAAPGVGGGAPFPAGTPGARGQRMAGGGAGGGNVLMGTIKEIGDGVLVLTDTNGAETEVKVTDTTLIEKNASVELTDLAAGETLMVSGSTGTDGTVTARSIQVAPQGRFGLGGAPGSEPSAPRAAQPTPAQ